MSERAALKIVIKFSQLNANRCWRYRLLASRIVIPDGSARISISTVLMLTVACTTDGRYNIMRCV
jgi:hypothetical protein